MKVKIPPAYLGMSASQSRRSKLEDRAVTRNIWMMQNGIRIPVRDMTDSHLVYLIRHLRSQALKIKDWAAWKESLSRDLARDFDKSQNDHWQDGFDFLFDTDDEGNYSNPFLEMMEDYARISKMSVEQILLEMVPCYPSLVLEGYTRNLLHSNGYPNNNGWRLLGRKKEQDNG